MPSIGVAVVLGVGLRRLLTSHSFLAQTSRFVLSAVLAHFAFVSYERSKDWMSDRTLFESAVAVCPSSAKLQAQLGHIELIQGNITAAKDRLDRALAIDPQFCDLDYYYGMLHVKVSQQAQFAACAHGTSDWCCYCC